MRLLTSMHWGVYEIEPGQGGLPALKPFREDPDPNPIGLHILSEDVRRLRVARPAVRKSYLEQGPGKRTELRGVEPFVEVEWGRALDLAAAELARVKKEHGNAAIFGGSYGWASAGRFHHAQSQIHRFLNCHGGYVRHMDSYSLAAARVVMPHIVASMDELMGLHTDWGVLEKETKLFVTFGGVPGKNAQIHQGGTSEHRVGPALAGMAKAGVRFVNVSPVRDDLATGKEFEWIAIRPNTDTAMILALCHTLYSEGLHAPEFLARYCVGFDRFVPYLTGASDGIAKDAAWAEAITGVPADRIAKLARDMAATRTMLNMSWSLQRSHHGEQPFWAHVTLAAMLGQIGLPGGGFGVGYGAVNQMGSGHPRFSGPTLPQGSNAVKDFIPVARIADMLLSPGTPFDYNGKRQAYPDIRLIYWAGGNPFHHHQDLGRLIKAWQKPETIIVNEQYWTAAARRADIVLPVTTTLERDDIGYANREKHMIAMRQAMPPEGEARDDHWIFAELGKRLGIERSFTEGLSPRQWLARIYEESRGRAKAAGVELPTFEAFWQQGLVEIAGDGKPVVMLDAFRADPGKSPLKTPSGRIEIFSERIASFAYDDCPGHTTWLEPAEWLGSDKTARFPLHLLSDQPARKLHSQLDASPHCQAEKIAGRQPVTMHPEDALARGVAHGDVVRLYNDRGACLAGASLSEDIRPGVVRLSTGAWYDPADPAVSGSLEKHGNPNALTRDVGASSLSQGCAAQTCLVEIERYTGELPEVTVHRRPKIIERRP
jgi:biotin/methionine sulfoxide reductase